MSSLCHSYSLVLYSVMVIILSLFSSLYISFPLGSANKCYCGLILFIYCWFPCWYFFLSSVLFISSSFIGYLFFLEGPHTCGWGLTLCMGVWALVRFVVAPNSRWTHWWGYNPSVGVYRHVGYSCLALGRRSFHLAVGHGSCMCGEVGLGLDVCGPV